MACSCEEQVKNDYFTLSSALNDSDVSRTTFEMCGHESKVVILKVSKSSVIVSSCMS